MEEQKTEQSKNIFFCNLHQGEDFIQMAMVLIALVVDIEMIVWLLQAGRDLNRESANSQS